MRVIYSLTRCWRCYMLLSFASVLTFFLYFISQYDPKLENYFQYNFYLNSGAAVEKIKKLMEATNLDYELINSNSKFCVNKIDIDEDITLLNNDEDSSFTSNKNKNSLDLILLIISQANNFRNRNVIRQTWSKQLKTNTRFLFVIGNPSFNSSTIDHNIKEKLNDELNRHNDLIQINMPDNDSYTPTKTLVAIRWSMIYCFVAKYLFILSDSAVLNVNLLYKQVDFNKIDKRALVGACNHTDEKFASALKIFFDGIYKKTKKEQIVKLTSSMNQTVETKIKSYRGEYCSSLGWLISSDGAERLWFAALRSTYIMKISPAFLNGYLAFKANLKHLSLFTFHDMVPENTNCLKVLDVNKNLMACAENFTISNRYNSFMATWSNAPAQIQFGMSKL